MMIGIRLHDLKIGTLEEVKEAILKQGFEAIQLVFKKALRDEENNPLLFNYENALKVQECFKNTNIKIAMLGAYFNPVHSNKELVKSNIEYFKEHLKWKLRTHSVRQYWCTHFRIYKSTAEKSW